MLRIMLYVWMIKVGRWAQKEVAWLTELKPGRDPGHLRTVPVTFLPRSAEFPFPKLEILVECISDLDSQLDIAGTYTASKTPHVF